MKLKDHYSALGVSKDAPQDEIKKRFRELAKKYHPDANKGDKQAEEKFKEISEAYEVLANPEKRAKYDKLRDAGEKGYDFSDFQRGGQTSGGSFDFSDVFGDMFGGAGQGRSRSGGGGFGDLFDLFFEGAAGGGRRTKQQRAEPSRGSDVTVRIQIPFDLAIAGGNTVIKVPRKTVCTVCSGSGAAPGSDMKRCASCGGRGVIQMAQGGFLIEKTCPECSGKGSVAARKCGSCSGTGETTETKQIKVKVPEGVSDGTKIRIKNEGNRGSADSRRGDLYVIFKVAQSPVYTREGNDLYYPVHISVAAAMLGSEESIKTPYGNVVVKIPAGIQSGSLLKIKERGVKDIKKGRPGDFYVKVLVDIPKVTSGGEKKLIEEFAKKKKLKY
ncbi:MAG: DnaJ C-terminal domain-containing protein [bacterium]